MNSPGEGSHNATRMNYSKNALLVFVLLAFAYGYFFHDPGPNGNSRLGLVLAIVEQGRVSIDSYHNNAGTKTTDQSYFNGHYYTDKAIGSSIIGAIIYAPIYFFTKLIGHPLVIVALDDLLTFLAIGLPSAFAGSLVYVLCEAITGSRLRAYLITLAITLGTIFLPFSAIYFGHALAGALLFISFFLIFQLKLRPDLRNNFWYLFLIGFLMGMAFLTEYPTAVILLFLILYYFYILRDKWSIAWFGKNILPAFLGGLIPIMILLIYDKLAFGDPLSIGYEHLDNPFKSAMSQGFFGIGMPHLNVLFYLTFHPAQGLFWQSPVLLMALAGFYFLWRDKRYLVEGIVSLGAILSLLLVNSGYFEWWGGFSFGPRHLTPIVLFFAIPLALLPRRFSPLVIVLGVISFGQMLIPLADNMLVPDKYFVHGGYSHFFGYSTIYSYSLQDLLHGKFTSSLGGLVFGNNWTVLIPFILGIVIVTAVIIRNEKRLRQHVPPEAADYIAV